MASTSAFIVNGIHVTENLEHHKVSDVRRILEEKGYAESSETGTDAIHFNPATGQPDGDKRTVIRFDDSGFVQENGVELEG